MPSVFYFSQISPFTQQLLCCILKIVNVKTLAFASTFCCGNSWMTFHKSDLDLLDYRMVLKCTSIFVNRIPVSLTM